MKRIAILVIFSIIVITNTHSSFITATKKDTAENKRKLAIYEHRLNGYNTDENLLKKSRLSLHDRNEHASVCLIDEVVQSNRERNNEVNSIHEIDKINYRQQLINEKTWLQSTGKNEQNYNDEVTNDMDRQYMIPNEAIRLRILAHSDAAIDQDIKRVVRDRVNEHISEIVAHIDNIEIARATIKEAIPRLEALIAETLTEYNQDYSYKVTFKKDVPFPLKTYGPYVYPAGDYEAILITLGAGLGENWWCVLFPPLCFIDFFNGTTVADVDESTVNETTDDEPLIESDHHEADLEVRFFLLDLFNFS